MFFVNIFKTVVDILHTFSACKLQYKHIFPDKNTFQKMMWQIIIYLKMVRGASDVKEKSSKFFV